MQRRVECLQNARQHSLCSWLAEKSFQDAMQDGSCVFNCYTFSTDSDHLTQRQSWMSLERVQKEKLVSMNETDTCEPEIEKKCLINPGRLTLICGRNAAQMTPHTHKTCTLVAVSHQLTVELTGCAIQKKMLARLARLYSAVGQDLGRQRVTGVWRRWTEQPLCLLD